MSLLLESAGYQPDGLWTPPDISDELQQQFDIYLAQRAYIPMSDVPLAEKLAKEVSRHFANGNINGLQREVIHPVYRAAKALEVGKGNCLAHAEATVAIGGLLGLPMSISWEQRYHTTGHASTVWDSGRAIWSVDGMTQAAKSLRPFNAHVLAEDTTSFETARDIIAESNGRFVMRTSDDLSKPVDWQPLPDTLGEADVPYENCTYVLPAAEGVQMLTAMGDARRYQQTQPDRWEAIREEVEQFIPPSLRPGQQVQ